MADKIRFHLPGLRYNFPLNMSLLTMKKRNPEWFMDNVEIGSIFGEFPTSRWNGGRFSGGDQCDAAFVRNVVMAINAFGVPIRYTYTNPLINEFDLDDEYCNYCMDVANNGMNEVLVFSPILEEYIREKYPKYKINSSTCKEIRDIDGLNAELDKDYALVVLDYNLNNKFDLLEKIEKKDKIELLVNACCVPDCPRRGAHYREIGKQQSIALKNRKAPLDKQIPVPQWHCEYGENNNIYTIQDYSTYISPQAIYEKYVPMGYSNFKLEGRTANIFNLVETYALYLIKPEYQGIARLELLKMLWEHHVISVNKPKTAPFVMPEK